MAITLSATELGKAISVDTYNAIILGVGIGVLVLVVTLIFRRKK